MGNGAIKNAADPAKPNNASIDEIFLNIDQPTPRSPISKNSLSVVPLDVISFYCTQWEQTNKNLEPAEPNCSIYLSYCWFDEQQSHQIAKKLTEHGLKLTMDKDKMSLDSTNAIYKSDVIVLCISKSYMSCDACLKEAHLSFQQEVPIIPILLVPGYKPDNWLAQIIAGKKYKLITADLKKYDYNASKDFIFNELKGVCSKVSKKISYPVRKINLTKKQLTAQIKKYNTNFDKKISNEKKLIDQNKIHIDKVFDDLIQSDGLKSEFGCVYRWLNKYPNVTISNYVPFSPTGDINDAIFAMAEEVKENFKKNLRISTSFGTQATTLSNKRTVNLCLIAKANQLTRPKEDVPIDSATELYMKLIKRSWKFNTSLPNGKLAWATIENRDFNNRPARTSEEIERRKILDSDLDIGRKRRVQLSKYFKCEQDTFCKFAQKMLHNLVTLEEFCKNFTHEKKKLIEEPTISPCSLDQKEPLLNYEPQEKDESEFEKFKDESIETSSGENNKMVLKKEHSLLNYGPQFFSIENENSSYQHKNESEFEEFKEKNPILEYETQFFSIENESSLYQHKNESEFEKFKEKNPILEYEPQFFMIDFYFK
ncbi:sterile alpha motif domain-containing [Brachionus plicatilis]|uniref:Sterile alpha motif domain-containing n=1 Tax=Brachionus plicatilis TaxID=10195 RepID=A0A3M7PHF7_BRAPC|nr:sterile alpha motif domain-containing [Brachionus plicatilis]